jgi:hypothetical protein
VNQDMSGAARGSVVAGLFHDPPLGERTLADLKAAGFTRFEISQVGGDTDSHPVASASAANRPRGPRDTAQSIGCARWDRRRQ